MADPKVSHDAPTRNSGADTVSRLDGRTLGAIRLNLGAETVVDTSCDAQINKMNPGELFERWCNWHGLINWSDTIVWTLANIREATGDRDSLREINRELVEALVDVIDAFTPFTGSQIQAFHDARAALSRARGSDAD